MQIKMEVSCDYEQVHSNRLIELVSNEDFFGLGFITFLFMRAVTTVRLQ